MRPHHAQQPEHTLPCLPGVYKNHCLHASSGHVVVHGLFRGVTSVNDEKFSLQNNNRVLYNYCNQSL